MDEKNTLDLNQINSLYDSLKDIVNGSDITTDSIVDITINLMQIVEKYPKIKGFQKKSLVLHVLKKFINEHLDGKNSELILSFVNIILPSIIDSIIAVDGKKIVIHARSLFKFCCT